jgi:hypothetical protein
MSRIVIVILIYHLHKPPVLSRLVNRTYLAPAPLPPLPSSLTPPSSVSLPVYISSFPLSCVQLNVLSEAT